MQRVNGVGVQLIALARDIEDVDCLVLRDRDLGKWKVVPENVLEPRSSLPVREGGPARVIETDGSTGNDVEEQSCRCEVAADGGFSSWQPQEDAKSSI